MEIVDPKYVTCGIPQGYFLGPFLFLVYVNNLPNASRLLGTIMFADDSNLFFNNKEIKQLFPVANKELVNIKDWFTANKLFLNVGISLFIYQNLQSINMKYKEKNSSSSLIFMYFTCTFITLHM